ncbi:MAG: OpgC domain-containing protein [Mycetocola sp.]
MTLETRTLDGWAGWVVVALVVAVTAVLFIAAVRTKSRPATALTYSGPANRDLRIDLLRGVAIVFIVVNQVGLVSVFQTASHEAIGIVTGAELFVLLSGVVLAMVHRSTVASGGIGEVVIRTTRRATKLYGAALAVVLLALGISLIPGISGPSMVTFTDGNRIPGSSGTVADLAASAGQLLSYPVSPGIIVDLALLRLGPWQFSVMGLYVVLLLVSPLLLWLLSRRWWVPLLATSVGLYLLSATTNIRLLPSQFEDSFPLLTWQLLFVVGLLGGYYRREIVAWFSTKWGTVMLGVLVALAVALAILSWNNPFLSSAADARLGLIPDATFRDAYGAYFERTYLDVGRLLNVVLVVIALYALLTAYWAPISRAVGWFFIPLGQATLYVFIVHVFFALLVWNIPALTEGSLWLNSAVYVVILGLLWVLVKTKFLFQLVPR